MLYMQEVERERRERQERLRKEYQKRLLMRAKVLSGVLLILLVVIGIMM